MLGETIEELVTCVVLFDAYCCTVIGVGDGLAIVIFISGGHGIGIEGEGAQQSKVSSFGTKVLGEQVPLGSAILVHGYDIPPVVNGASIGECLGVVIPEVHGAIECKAVLEQLGVDVCAEICRIVGLNVAGRQIVIIDLACGILGVENVSRYVAGFVLGLDLCGSFVLVKVVYFYGQIGILLLEGLAGLHHLAGAGIYVDDAAFCLSHLIELFVSQVVPVDAFFGFFCNNFFCCDLFACSFFYNSFLSGSCAACEHQSQCHDQCQNFLHCIFPFPYFTR